MQLKSVRVENFCAIKDETLQCTPLTALVGANGTGKSSFLRAIAAFFGPCRDVTIDDVYNRQPDTEIRITVTFSNLSPEVKGQLGAYVTNDEVIVTKVLSLNGRVQETYYGHRPINPEFETLRRVPAAEMAKQYAALRSTPKYNSLPYETTKKAMQPALEQWEAAHPEECVIAEDSGDFFGLDSGNFAIKDHLEFVLVPAVRDAAEDVSGRGFVPQLLERLAERLLTTAAATQDALGRARTEILATIKPAEDEKLASATSALNETLRRIAPNADIRVSWSDAQLELVPPQASVEIGEDNYCTSVTRSGHGVQRALVMAILQHEATGDSEDIQPAAKTKRLLLAIEEPELYQHPNRQRHMADVLHQLAAGAGGETETTQVVLATHSPLFVRLEYFDSVRRAFKKPAEGGPPATHLVRLELTTLADKLAALDGSPVGSYTADTLRARLRGVMTPWMNEGFFARKIVLVEGDSDRAAVMAAARVHGIKLEEEGVSVIPTTGKSLLDRPYLIFSTLGIPTYVMWDGDYEEDKGDTKTKNRLTQSARLNRRLLRLVGRPEVDFPEEVAATYAVHRVKLEATLKEEMGQAVYDKVLEEAAAKFGYERHAEVLKSPEAMEYAIKLAIEAGADLIFLRQVAEAVNALPTESGFRSP